MRVILVSIRIKPGYKDRFINAMIDDAKGSVNDEPGCLRFDVMQDGEDPDKIWLYEVYQDEAAVAAHQIAPHFLKWKRLTSDWVDEISLSGGGTTNIWPSDDDWT